MAGKVLTLIGCNELTREGYCDKHKGVAKAELKQRRKRYDSNRPEWHSMYESRRWRETREAYLRQHPLCVECEKKGYLVPAVVCDHIVPHRGKYELFWDISNLQGLCARCHGRKTAKEDGGFNNPRK